MCANLSCSLSASLSAVKPHGARHGATFAGNAYVLSVDLGAYIPILVQWLLYYLNGSWGSKVSERQRKG